MKTHKWQRPSPLSRQCRGPSASKITDWLPIGLSILGKIRPRGPWILSSKLIGKSKTSSVSALRQFINIGFSQEIVQDCFWAYPNLESLTVNFTKQGFPLQSLPEWLKLNTLKVTFKRHHFASQMGFLIQIIEHCKVTLRVLQVSCDNGVLPGDVLETLL